MPPAPALHVNSVDHISMLAQLADKSAEKDG
jgi:hypothetical protein